MKTTVDIPDKELQDAMRFTKAKTEDEAVNAAVAEFNRLRRVERIVKDFGTSPDFPTNEEIEAAEAGRQREIFRDAD